MAILFGKKGIRMDRVPELGGINWLLLVQQTREIAKVEETERANGDRFPCQFCKKIYHDPFAQLPPTPDPLRNPGSSPQ